jgi:hypothetical protein
MLHGRCLCGAVAYEIDGTLGEAHHCHCSLCRRLHGAPFSTFAQVAASAFRIVRGTGELRAYRATPPVERTFCGTCGARLTFRFDGLPDAVWVTVTTLDPEPPLTPAGHMFTDSKAPWFPITDALPQYPEYPPFGE